MYFYYQAVHGGENANVKKWYSIFTKQEKLSAKITVFPFKSYAIIVPLHRGINFGGVLLADLIG